MLTQSERASLRITNSFYAPSCAYELTGILDGYMDWAEPIDREIVRGAFSHARSKGLISRDELIESYNVGIVARSKRDNSDNPSLAVVKATFVFDRTDLESVARSAQQISEIMGAETDAYLVTQEEWPAEMDDIAREFSVTIILHPIPEYASLNWNMPS